MSLELPITEIAVFKNSMAGDNVSADGGFIKRSALLSSVELIFLSIVFSTICLLIILNNLTIIVSFIIDNQLRTIQNFYIFNLAICDLLIGCFGSPFQAVYDLLGYWPLGWSFCKIWMILDYLVTTESMLTILCISWDRYLYLGNAQKYHTQQTARRVIGKIFLSWLASFGLFASALVGWKFFGGQSKLKESECYSVFIINFAYTLTISVLEFYIPLLVICILNIRIYRVIHKRCAKFNINGENSSSCRISCSSQTLPLNDKQSNDSMSQEVGLLLGKGNSEKSSGLNCLQRPHYWNYYRTMKRDKRITKALSLLVIAFIVCWTPYSIASIVISICDSCISQQVYGGLYWILYVKSLINPWLYAHSNRRFRKNFKTVWCFFKKC